MRIIKNFKLSTNFSFYEMIEGTEIPKAGHIMNWKNILQCDIDAQMDMARQMEFVRQWINFKFRDKNGGKTIGIEITAGWRCLEWEIFKKRSGLSQHVKAAIDGRVTNTTKALQKEILYAVKDEYWPKWKGGFAIAEPKVINGIETTGFFHFDPRPVVARWYY